MLVTSLAPFATLVAPTRAQTPRPFPIRSLSVEISYETAPEAHPLDSVELWYVRDGERNWILYGYDEDRRSPMTFVAPEEGLFGLFVILRNTTGPSSMPPAAGSEAHQWVLVDPTPPVVQFHVPTLTKSLGVPVAQLRWSAVDGSFSPRPIEIEYKRPQESDWRSVADGPLPNVGRYDWRVPEALTGPVHLRIAAQDGAGNRVVSQPHTIDIAPAAQRITELTRAPVPSPEPSPSMFVDRAALSGSKRSRDRAAILFEEALDLRGQGAMREAITRLRQVVMLDPRHTQAFAEMATMLHSLGDLDKALSAYEISLKQKPNMRQSLLGAARVFSTKKNYESAAGHLRTILRYSPNDAEVWMNLGDVAVYRGDEVAAREYYTRASEIDPGATEIVDQAQRRLRLMNSASRLLKDR